MMRRSQSIVRGIMIVIAALCTGTMTTLAAQQPTGVVQQPSSPNTQLSGPRLRAEWPRYEPRFAENASSPSALAAAAGGSHTIVFSTLALVIIGVIVLVLVL